MTSDNYRLLEVLTDDEILHIIIATVASLHMMTSPQLTSYNRQPGKVRARGIVTELARELTALSYPEIGAALGRHHASLTSGRKRLALWLQTPRNQRRYTKQRERVMHELYTKALKEIRNAKSTTPPRTIGRPVGVPQPTVGRSDGSAQHSS